ncbi:MAG: DUF4160 domain-containing protein [Deltaproteobacteria bacterium]|nr:DUF4160 domain-containing protein [Deltaproteobacteria bacterium]
MPTILTENGYRLFFYANERTEPPHVHVDYQGARAKFWIQPVCLARNLGMTAAQLSKAEDLVLKHEKLIREKWDEFFSKKS